MTSHLDSKIDWYSDETASTGRGYPDLLSNTNIKAVIIALPITAQPPFIKQALEAGKHVLSEKPIAADSSIAKELLEFANSVGAQGQNRTTWSIAENWRWLPSHAFAASQVAEMGRILGFRVRVHNSVKAGGKYYETSWRKMPEYQGGFLLDGGIHYIAAMRQILGPENGICRVSAFTGQLQAHLPPVDTVDAVLRAQSGVSGTFSVSFGTTARGGGYGIACEMGTVTAMRGRVVVTRDGVEGEETFEFPDEGAGVRQEVQAWAEGIAGGTMDLRLSPDEALKDLELLEAMLRSGEQGGVPFDVQP